MRYCFVCIIALILSSIINAQGKNANLNHQEKGQAKALQSEATLKNPFSDKISSALEGKEIFVQNCASCHGTEGLGNGPAGASVIPKPDNLTSKEIHRQSDGDLFLGIKNGAHGVMIPWKFILSENQIWHLVDCIRELRKKSE